MLDSGSGSLVIGAIHRSISASNTASVPIQKIANSSPPSTTPAQVCSQFIEARKVDSMTESTGSEVCGERHAEGARCAQYQAGRTVAARPVVGIQEVIDIEACDEHLAL